MAYISVAMRRICTPFRSLSRYCGEMRTLQREVPGLVDTRDHPAEIFDLSDATTWCMEGCPVWEREWEQDGLDRLTAG